MLCNVCNAPRSSIVCVPSAISTAIVPPRLDERMRQLRANKDSLERFAREHYLMHCDEEDVYIVKDDTID